MARNYLINNSIRVHYCALGADISLTDLLLTVTDPAGSDGVPIAMTHIANGIYKADWTPTTIGLHIARVTSVLSPFNADSTEYFVGGTITDGEHFADIDTSGRLRVVVEPPTVPPNTAAAGVTAYNTMSGSQDDTFVIPNGETLFLQTFSAGGEEVTDGNSIELWHDPNGNGSGMTIIDVIFANGVSAQHILNDNFLGDGIAAIRLRRNRLSGGSGLIFGRWEGYY